MSWEISIPWENLEVLYVDLRNINDALRRKLSEMFGVSWDSITDEFLAKTPELIELISETKRRMDEELLKIIKVIPPIVLNVPRNRRRRSKIHWNAMTIKALPDLEKPFLLGIIQELWWHHVWWEEEKVVLRAVRLLRVRVKYMIEHPHGIVLESSVSLGWVHDRDFIEDIRLHNSRAKPIKFRS